MHRDGIAQAQRWVMDENQSDITEQSRQFRPEHAAEVLIEPQPRCRRFVRLILVNGLSVGGRAVETVVAHAQPGREHVGGDLPTAAGGAAAAATRSGGQGHERWQVELVDAHAVLYTVQPEPS